jgi:Acyltransferase family
MMLSVMKNADALKPVRRRIFYPGLEYLRILFIVLIAGWHTKVLGQTTFDLHPTAFNLPSFAYFGFFLLGAPLFFVVSLFLYIQHRRPGYFAKRLLALAIFWIAWNAISFALLADQGSAYSWIAPSTLLGGGFGPLYFIFDLIIITIITEFICICRERFKTKKFSFVLYLALVVNLIYLVMTPFILKPGHVVTNYLLSFQSVLNFLPYAIAAFLISEAVGKQDAQEEKVRNIDLVKFSALFGLGALIAFVEYHLYNRYLPTRYFSLAYPFYDRISVFVMVVAIFYLFLKLKGALNRYVAMLASLTSGVFIIHYLILELVETRFPSWFALDTYSPGLFLVALLVVSYALSWILKHERVAEATPRKTSAVSRLNPSPVAALAAEPPKT